MATDKKNVQNIDLSDLAKYPNGRIRDNSGTGDGTPVNRLVYSDLHEFFAKLMRLAGITYNGLPDNETNGYQLIDALAAVASKNSLLYSLNTVGGVISVNTNLAIVKNTGFLLCKATFNKTTETLIKGLAATTYATTITSAFKANDYILLVNNGGNYNLIRLATADNIDMLVAAVNYLKAATEAEEYTGTSLVKATTPYTNQLAFARRVIGLDSGIFLATTLRNGLLSKEDKAILDGLVNPVKNVGWFSGLDVSRASQVGSNLPRSGDVVSAVVTSVVTTQSIVLVTMANAMIASNYYIRLHIQSEGEILADNNIFTPIFKIVSSTQFQFCIEEYNSVVQNLKIHIEAVQIS